MTDIVADTRMVEEQFHAELDEFLIRFQTMQQTLQLREEEIESLRAQLGQQYLARLSYPFTDLQREAQAATAMTVGWQTEFENQTGHTNATVEKWKKENSVPGAALLQCLSLQPGTAKVRISWKNDPRLQKRLRELRDGSKLPYNEFLAYALDQMSRAFPEYEWSINTLKGALIKSRIAQA